MSIRRRQLQDESAKISTEIDQLRSLESLDETGEGRLNELATRADQVAAALLREDDLDKKLAALARPGTGNAEPRGDEGGEKRAERPVIGGAKGFSSVRAAALVGGYLRQLFTGEVRAMGETSPTYDAKGVEYVIGELYSAVVNRLQYQSVALQLATVVQVAGQKISFPKVGDATASLIAEGTATTDQDLATSAADLILYEMRASCAVSRSLLDDSPIDVAGLVTERFSTSYAAKMDAITFGGNASSPSITGLAAAVAAIASNPNTVTVGVSASTTNNNLADVIGKVDESIMGTGVWVASKAGYVDLMKLWAAQQTVQAVGNGRMLPTIWGAPVYLVKGLPSTTLALYGDFKMSTAIGLKSGGIEIEAGREILMRNRQVLYVANTRFGVANHAPEFVGRLAKATS